jgi:hypothetical protein
MPRKLAYGEPPDINGACNARLHLGDNHGDNHITFVCQLEPCHDGPHQEMSRQVDEKGTTGSVTTLWDFDEGPRYAACRCECGLSDDIIHWYGCHHLWENDECSDCGMTRAEHTTEIEKRRRENP